MWQALSNAEGEAQDVANHLVLVGLAQELVVGVLVDPETQGINSQLPCPRHFRTGKLSPIAWHQSRWMASLPRAE